MVYEYEINGKMLKTGDIISTGDGNNSIYSLGFRLLGAVIPGKVDHSLLYIGPDGLCVESGIFGVVTFNAEHVWDSERTFPDRMLIDSFYAASSVFPGRGIASDDETRIREFVRAYAIGSVGKPYNFDFFHPDIESRVYCSQLVYLAYKHAGIDLNVGTSGIPGTDRIVFPQEILDNTTQI